MPHLELPGAVLYYETAGEVSMPAVLLIHAGIATLRMWDSLVPALADDHFVIRFDTRGFGETTTDDVEFSNRLDAIDLLDHLGVQAVTVVGASRGGMIGIDIALEYPDRVAGLVTVGSGPGGYPETELSPAEKALEEQIDAAEDASDWPALTDLEVQLWVIGPTRSEADLDPEFIEIAYSLNRANAARRTDDPTPIVLDPPAYGRLDTITVPALTTVGDHDLTHVRQTFEYLRATIPGAESHRFRASAHLPSVEQPDEFAEVLTDWLSRHSL